MDPASRERQLATIVGATAAQALLEDDEVLGLFAFGVAQACFGARRYQEATGWARRGLGRRPEWLVLHALHAASCGQLGQLEDAAVALAQLQLADPGFSLRKVRLLFSGSEPEFLERLVDGLRRAGI